MKFKLAKTVVSFFVLFASSTTIFAYDQPVTSNRVLDYKTINQSSKVKQQGKYVNATATVVKVLYQNNSSRIIAKTSDDQLVALNVSANTPMYYFDSQVFTFGEGDTIVFAYDGSQEPVKIGDAPAQIEAYAVVGINKELFQNAIIDYFDGNFLNSDYSYELNTTPSTQYFDTNAHIIQKEKLKNQNLIVLYTTVPSGAPKRVFAKTVISLEGTPVPSVTSKTVDLILNDFIDDQVLVKDDLKYIKISSLAAKYDYEILWDDINKTLIVKNDKDTYELTTLSKQFKHNGLFGYLANPIVLDNNRAYIEVNFAKKFLLAVLQNK